MQNLAVGRPVVITGNGSAQQVIPGGCTILGFFVSSGTTPSLIINDAGNGPDPATARPVAPAAANVVLAATTITGGTYYPFPATLNNGLNITVTGTAIITFFVL